MKRLDIKKRPLSDTTLYALEPDVKEYRELDSEQLYFVVSPSGRKRWELRYKKNDGKWSFLGLGAFPHVGAKLAREKAFEMKRKLSNGESPLKEKQAKLESEKLSFKSVAVEFCNSKKWTSGTRTRNEGALKNHVYPKFQDTNIKTITKKQWFELFESIQKKKHPQTGKPIIEMGKRICTLCREIYDYAEVKGYIEFNPVERTSKYLIKSEKNNMPHVAENELPELLNNISNYNSRSTSLALIISVLLGVRPVEIRLAEWSEFDFENRLWTINADRMKKRKVHIVPLSTQVVNILNELKSLSGESIYLFPSRSSLGKPISNNTLNCALKRMGYRNKQTPHGFRHIMSTILREKGYEKDHVEAALAHSIKGVEGVYNKAIYLQQRREMMQDWSNYIDSLKHNE